MLKITTLDQFKEQINAQSPEFYEKLFTGVNNNDAVGAGCKINSNTNLTDENMKTNHRKMFGLIKGLIRDYWDYMIWMQSVNKWPKLPPDEEKKVSVIQGLLNENIPKDTHVQTTIKKELQLIFGIVGKTKLNTLVTYITTDDNAKKSLKKCDRILDVVATIRASAEFKIPDLA